MYYNVDIWNKIIHEKINGFILFLGGKTKSKQSHGPGSFFDKNGRLSGTMGSGGKNNDIVLSEFSLCDFNKRKPFYSTSGHDCCNLTPDECKKQHKETDHNYDFYHSSPTSQEPSDVVIKVKWD